MPRLRCIIAAALCLGQGWAADDLSESRIAANEAAAATTLKSSVFPAQVCFGAGSYNDVDQDMRGEYGFIPELAGLVGTQGGIEPGMLTFLGANHTGPEAIIHGYHYQVFLPDGAGGALTYDDFVTRLAAKDTSGCDEREMYWIAYAWPAEVGSSGRKVFAITQDGKVYVSTIAEAGYRPVWNALVGGRDVPFKKASRGPDWPPYIRPSLPEIEF
ncbi:MAG: hypothetical protein ACYTF0_08395 [Planctomycetota bacterium]|jgi:hypothetical protein